MENDKEKYNGEPTPDPGDNRWNVSVSSSVNEKPSPKEPEIIPAAADEIPAGLTDHKQKSPVWLIMLAIIGVYFALNFIGSMVMYVSKPADGTTAGMRELLYRIIIFGTTIGFAWWICRQHGTLPRKPLNFSLKKTNPTLILWGLILAVITSMVIEPMLDLFPREYIERINANIGSGGWAMVSVIVAAPILEEILFRGIIQQQLVGSYGRIKGLLMAAAIFGVAHIYPQQAVNAFFVGIILGYLYIRSGSLIPAIIIHAVNNAIAYIIIQFSGGNFMLTKDLFGNQTFYWIVYAVCCVIFIIAAWNLMRELKKLDEEFDDGGRATKPV